LIVGLLYLLLTSFGGLGDALDLGVDGAIEGTGIDTILGIDSGASDASGLGCIVIAAFMAGFGALGLTGMAAGWNLLLILVIAVLFGDASARGAGTVLKYAYSQQADSVDFSPQDLIGMSARVSINTPAGKTSEVVIETDKILKYPAQEINDNELKRGDIVEIVDVSGRFLRVKLKNG